MGQALNTLDPTFPKIQPIAFLRDPPCLVNAHVFETPGPQVVAQAFKMFNL